MKLVESKVKCVSNLHVNKPWLPRRFFTNGGIVITRENISQLQKLAGCSQRLQCGMNICRKCCKQLIPEEPIPFELSKIVGCIQSLPDSIANVPQVNMELNRSDLDRLRVNEMFNDNLVDLGILLLKEKLSDFQDQFHIFNSQFYPILRKDASRCANRIERKAKLMNRDFICVPICKDMHWITLILCFPHRLFAKDKYPPFILYCNSINESPDLELVYLLRQYALFRYNYETGQRVDSISQDDLPLVQAVLPLQPNVIDCALYMLNNINSVLFYYFYGHEVIAEKPDLYTQKDIMRMRRELLIHVLDTAHNQRKISKQQKTFIRLVTNTFHHLPLTLTPINGITLTDSDYSLAVTMIKQHLKEIRQRKERRRLVRIAKKRQVLAKIWKKKMRVVHRAHHCSCC